MTVRLVQLANEELPMEVSESGKVAVGRIGSLVPSYRSGYVNMGRWGLAVMSDRLVQPSKALSSMSVTVDGGE